jgi:hypothetical protein
MSTISSLIKDFEENVNRQKEYPEFGPPDTLEDFIFGKPKPKSEFLQGIRNVRDRYFKEWCDQNLDDPNLDWCEKNVAYLVFLRKTGWLGDAPGHENLTVEAGPENFYWTAYMEMNEEYVACLLRDPARNTKQIAYPEHDYGHKIATAEGFRDKKTGKIGAFLEPGL